MRKKQAKPPRSMRSRTRKSSTLVQKEMSEAEDGEEDEGVMVHVSAGEVLANANPTHPSKG